MLIFRSQDDYLLAEMTENHQKEETDTNSLVRSIDDNDFEVLLFQKQQQLVANDSVIDKVNQLSLFKV